MPAVAESVAPGFDLGSWVVIAAPAKTPAEILRKFAAEAVKALQVEDVRARLRQVGASAAGGTPEEALRFHRAEYEKWGALVKATGARAE